MGNDDLIEKYLFLTTSHDGFGSITIVLLSLSEELLRVTYFHFYKVVEHLQKKFIKTYSLIFLIVSIALINPVTKFDLCLQYGCKKLRHKHNSSRTMLSFIEFLLTQIRHEPGRG